MKPRLNRKPSGEGVPEFGLLKEARERLGISIESAASLIDMSAEDYAFAERWPTCMDAVDAIILADAFGISAQEFTRAVKEYFDKLMRLGLMDVRLKS